MYKIHKFLQSSLKLLIKRHYDKYVKNNYVEFKHGEEISSAGARYVKKKYVEK